jgi:ankyrin repeat protein
VVPTPRKGGRIQHETDESPRPRAIEVRIARARAAFRPRTLKSAAEAGDAQAILYHLQRGSDVNATTAAGHFALGGAVINGHAEAVALLLVHGADVNMLSVFHWSPLYLACWKGHARIAQLLIAAGAKLHCRTRYGWNSPDGWTPLHVAAAGGYTDVARVLVRAGARLTARDGADQTPLDVARDYGHRGTARFLRRAALKGPTLAVGVAGRRPRHTAALVALRPRPGNYLGD